MNAVERLLAHAEQVVSLFDEMLAEGCDIPKEVDDMVSIHWPTQHGELTELPDLYFSRIAFPTKAWTAERVAIANRWASHEAMLNAMRQAWSEGLRSTRDLPPRIVEVYCGWLATRERLLDAKTLRVLGAGVVRESLLWGPHATTVTKLADSLRAAIGRLHDRLRYPLRTLTGRRLMLTHIYRFSTEWVSEKQQYLMPAIDALHGYALPPALVVPSPAQKPRSAEKKTHHATGGRPDKWPKVLKKQILADHARYLRACKGRKPLKQTAWVTEWATKDGREMSRKDALSLWRAAKREQYRRQTQ